MLIEKRSYHVVDELILAVEHIKRERGNESDKRYQNKLADKLQNKAHKFFHASALSFLNMP